MSSMLASVLFRRFAARSEEQELSVRPSAGPSHFSLSGQRKVTKRKATPRPRPLRIRAQRVRVSRSGFSDRPSVACRKPWPHPCGQPCGLIDRLPPLPRGPGQSAGSCPQEPNPEREASPALPRSRPKCARVSSHAAPPRLHAVVQRQNPSEANAAGERGRRVASTVPLSPTPLPPGERGLQRRSNHSAQACRPPRHHP